MNRNVLIEWRKQMRIGGGRDTGKKITKKIIKGKEGQPKSIGNERVERNELKSETLI